LVKTAIADGSKPKGYYGRIEKEFWPYQTDI
jgi:hypothetical protein